MTAALRRGLLVRPVVGFLTLLCLALAVVALEAGSLPTRVSVVWLLLVCATLPIWSPPLTAWRKARGPLWPSQPTRWQLTSEGLAVENDLGMSTFRWSTLTKAEAGPRGVSMRRGQAIVFIPNRAFQGHDHRQAFVAAVEGCIAASHG